MATVSANGKVKARGPGSCLIYVLTNNGIYKVVKIKVDARPTKVAFKNPPKTIKVGVPVNLGAKVVLKPGKAQTKLKWKSSNTRVARVDANGVVTGIKKGTVTITVTTSNGKKASVKITVK